MKTKRLTVIAFAILIVLQTLSFVIPADAETFKQGSYGTVVKQIQQKLKNWGYYTGAVDGVYGPKTVAAVKFFQRKNNLKQDGLCGPQTQRAMGIYLTSSVPAGSQKEADVALLARLISAEARGESYAGQVAVGAVVLNRVRHPSFPGTIAGVIYQPGAFSCLNDGQFDKPVANSAINAARDAINGSDPAYGAIYYFNPKTATSAWIWSRPLIVTIGNHRFCK